MWTKTEPIGAFLKESVSLISNTKNESGSAWFKPGIRNQHRSVIGSTAIWLDIDALKENLKIQETQIAIQNLSPKPSLIIWSGGGFHIYWLLSSFCSDINRLNRIFQGLANTLPRNISKGLDKQLLSQGVTGGMRIPNSMNHKWMAPSEVTLLNSHTVNGEIKRYGLDELPEISEKRSKSSRLSSPKDVFLKYFPNLDPTKIQHSLSCPFHDDETPSFSLHLERGQWSCFSPKHEGDKEGGAVLFYAKMENKTLSEAKKELAFVKDEIDNENTVQKLKDLLIGRFSSLYREGENSIVGICRASQELVTISIGHDNQLQVGLARALGGAPRHVVSKEYGAEFLNYVENPKEGTSLIKYYRDILLDIFVKLPADLHFKLIGSGIHQIKTSAGWKTFMVNGEKIYENENLIWKKLDLDGPAYGKIIPKFGQNEWYPWWQTEWGPIPTPEKMFNDLFQIINPSWSWSEEIDPYMITLFTMYVWYHGWFGRPLEVFIAGRSHSGKSNITEGLFAGTRAGTIGLIPSITFKEASMAGFYQTAAYQGKLLVLDEIYDSKKPVAQQLMEGLRNLDANDFAFIRGTPGGKSVRYPVQMPIIWSAIEGPKMEQDLNRKIMIYMKKREGQQDPWDRILMNHPEEDLHKIRAALPLYLLPYQEHVMKARDKIVDKFLRSGMIPFRKGQMLMPLLQIATVAGVNVDKLADALTNRAQKEEEELTSEGIDRELITFLLDYKIYNDGDQEYETLARKIVAGRDFSDPNTTGVYYRTKSKKIYIQGVQLCNNVLAKIPNFRDINQRSLSNILKPQNYYEGTEPVWLGQDFGTRRVHRLDAEKTLQAMEIDLKLDKEYKHLR